MKPSLVLTIASVYLGFVGLALLLVPTSTVFGLPADPTPVLVAQLRAFSDVFLGVAVLNWLARNAEASKALNAIILGNAVGFGLSTILGAFVALTGGQVASWGFTAVSLFCAVGFIAIGRANMSSAA